MNQGNLLGVIIGWFVLATALSSGPRFVHASVPQEPSSAQGEAESPTTDELLARHPINSLLIQDPQAPDATATLEELAAGVEAYADRLASLPEFLVETKVVDVKQGAPSLYGHRIPGFRRMIARKDDAWLAMSTELHDEAFVPYYALSRDGITLSQELRRFSLVWRAGARFSLAQPHTMLMGIDMLRDLPGSEQLEKEKLRHCLLKPKFLDQLEKYSLLPKQQKIDGAWCHVVQFAGYQTLWIDTNLGFAVRQRVYDWHEGGSCERVIMQREFQEIVPGLSFPYTIVEELYAQPLKVERPFWNQVTSTSTHEILRLETEDVDQGIFHIPVPEGSEVYDYVRKKQFVVSHEDEEPFQEALEFSRRMGERSWTTIGFGLGALGGLLLAIMFGRKAYLLSRGR